jgi:hypothetical protein
MTNRLDLRVDWLATKGKFYIALRFPTACRDRRSGGYVCSAATSKSRV